MTRIADAVIAGVLLVLALPLMIIVAVAIRWDSPGPVFEHEPCVGRRGRRFQLLQFRTTAYAPEDPKTAWSQRRLTGVGALLRYTRIETLPQLLNVLKGDTTMIDADARWPSFLE